VEAAGEGAFLFVGAGALLYAVCAVLFLELATTGRYMVAVLPSAAIAAAVGLAAAEDRFRLPRGILTAGFAAGSAIAVGPALVVLHTRLSPPVEAAARLKALTRGNRYSIVYPASMYVPAELLFPGVPKFELEKTSGDVLAGSALPVWRFGVPAPDDDRAAAWPPYRTFSSLGMGRICASPRRVAGETAIFGEDGFRRNGTEGDVSVDGKACGHRLPPARTDHGRFVLVTVPKAFAPAESSNERTILDRRDRRRADLTYRLQAAPAGSD
jgi:hypothetical protein